VLLTMVAVTATAATARMQLPDGFREQADFFNASGFRGHRSGDFTIGTYNGEFSNKDSRLDVGDATWVSNKARTSVRLAHPDTGESATAACGLTKGTLNVGVVTFDPKKLHYDCQLHVEDDVANLVVGQAKGTTGEKLMARDLRHGAVEFPGLALTVRSVHGYLGSKFTSQAPVGYLIEANDRTLAAVELTDTSPSVYLSRELPPDESYRVMLVAMTIALLPDELE